MIFKKIWDLWFNVECYKVSRISGENLGLIISSNNHLHSLVDLLKCGI